jgi:acyl carrier protein
LLSDKLEKILREHARFVSDDADIGPDEPLSALGVDSLDMFELIVHIEDDFDIAIPPQQINPQTFATPATIWRMLCQVDPELAAGQE